MESKMLVQLHYFRNEFDSSRKYIDTLINGRYYAEFTAMFDPLIYLGSTGHSIYEMSDSVKQIISSIADTGSEDRIIAQNIMSSVFGNEYLFIPDTINAEDERFAEKNKVENKSSIIVHPNPFTSQTTITFTIPENTQKALILISDVMGRIVQRIEPNTTGKKDYVFDDRGMNQNLYYISLLFDGSLIDHQKMLLIK
jgi:hypothetical protein